MRLISRRMRETRSKLVMVVLVHRLITEAFQSMVKGVVEEFTASACASTWNSAFWGAISMIQQ